VLAVALPGLLVWWRRDRAGAAAAVLLVGIVLVTAGSWHMWRGGFNPPGRFLVPVVPVLAVAVANAWDRRGLGAGAALLLGFSLWVGVAGGLEPRLVHRDRDGTAPFFREHSGALEWTGLLPGYVLAERGRGRLAALWSGALLLALPWRSRAPTPVRFAVAGLGWMAAAQAAAALTDTRTDDRDAVRLVGRPAVGLPELSYARSVEAVWAADSLSWGPAYEPHRHPGGAELGRRLPLPPGRYELRAEAQVLSPEPSLPWLETDPDRPVAPRSALLALRGPPSGVGGTVEVRPGDHGVTLRLREGGPLLVERWYLRFNPSGPGRSKGEEE
jgi:hypothetical protein